MIAGIGFHGFGAYQAVAMLLIALGFGYFIGVKARCEEQQCCRRFGKFISWLIIIVASLALLCLGYRSFSACCERGLLPPGATDGNNTTP